MYRIIPYNYVSYILARADYHDAQVAGYQPYWAARAALLARAGNAQAAAEAYRRAIGLESDPAVRRFLQRQLAACRS